MRDDLSAAARTGATLFLACDETTGVERLTRDGDDWGNHCHFNLAEWVDLPDGEDGEMDIEGLCIDGDWLWITGSHSLKRGNPKDASGATGLRRLSQIKWDPNRQFFGRVPLARKDGVATPVPNDGKRVAGHLAFGGRGRLRKWLRKDPLLGDFLNLPSKDNGLDIEGIAVRDMRIWLGLRGPVLRGHAVVLEMELKETRPGRLKPRRIDAGRRYRMHLLDLGGGGVRDLALDGDDLLLLTGTPLAGDGQSRIYRWSDALDVRASGLHRGLAVALELPYRNAEGNPEGLARWDDDTWLVVHDSPHPARLGDEPATFLADLWHLTG